MSRIGGVFLYLPYTSFSGFGAANLYVAIRVLDLPVMIEQYDQFLVPDT